MADEPRDPVTEDLVNDLITDALRKATLAERAQIVCWMKRSALAARRRTGAGNQSAEGLAELFDLIADTIDRGAHLDPSAAAPDFSRVSELIERALFHHTFLKG